jgi:hypothetical protein
MIKSFLILLLVCGCIAPEQPQNLITSSTQPFCPPNYLQVGIECCLDLDGNGICDRDETTTTSSFLPTTTSTTQVVWRTTTTLLETTTTTLYIECSVNADCGQTIEERSCYRGDVYIRKYIKMCQKPGTVESRCVTRQQYGSAPVERCSGDRHCIDGECVKVT